MTSSRQTSFWKLELLEEDSINRIHLCSLNILKEIGVKIHNEELLQRLSSTSGIAVDYQKREVKFDPGKVEKAIKMAGKNFIYFGRDYTKKAKFGHGGKVFSSSAGQWAWVDWRRKKRRHPNKQDFFDAIKLADALENIDVVGGMAEPEEIPREVRDIFTHKELIKRTKKPVVAWINCKNTAEYILKIFEAVSGGAKELQDKPLIKGLVTPVSPLQFNKEGSDILMLFADRGLPLGFGSMVMAMVSGPATLAGTVALQNAEVLAGITISQLLRPGLPVLYVGIPHISDPRNVNISFGSPEQGIMAVMITELSKKYGFPAAINVGLTDSNVPDGQAGVEKASTMLLGMLAGADAYGGMGISGADQGFNIAQLVIDDETIAYLKRIIKGAEVSDETLAYNVIKEVGIGGSFISTDHTMRHFKKELWFPTIFERLGWEAWEESGRTDLLERAGEKAEKIILQQKEEEIDRDLGEEIDAIYAVAEKEILGA